MNINTEKAIYTHIYLYTHTQGFRNKFIFAIFHLPITRYQKPGMVAFCFSESNFERNWIEGKGF